MLGFVKMDAVGALRDEFHVGSDSQSSKSAPPSDVPIRRFKCDILGCEQTFACDVSLQNHYQTHWSKQVHLQRQLAVAEAGVKIYRRLLASADDAATRDNCSCCLQMHTEDSERLRELLAYMVAHNVGD